MTTLHRRRTLAGFALALLLAGIVLLLRPWRAERTDSEPPGPGAAVSSPTAPALPESEQAKEVGKQDPRVDGRSARVPTTLVSALPYEDAEAARSVRIDFDERGRLEVEAGCPPDLVVTIDVSARIGGAMEWLAGSDGLADLRGNLDVGNLGYLSMPHGSTLRTTLATFGVAPGADVEVKLTFHDLEGRLHHEELFRLRAR